MFYLPFSRSIHSFISTRIITTIDVSSFPTNNYAIETSRCWPFKLKVTVQFFIRHKPPRKFSETKLGTFFYIHTLFSQTLQIKQQMDAQITAVMSTWHCVHNCQQRHQTYSCHCQVTTEPATRWLSHANVTNGSVTTYCLPWFLFLKHSWVVEGVRVFG